MNIKEKTLEELAKEIAEKIADEFMKSILSKLVSETIGLIGDVNGLKQSMEKVWEAIDRLAEAQKRTEERLNELAEAQKRTEETLNSFITEFRDFSIWAKEIFGVWSHVVGFGAEAIIRDIFRTIAERGGFKFGKFYFPPLESIAPLKVKKDGYQFDLVGYYGKTVWIIEVKTRFMFAKGHLDDLIKSLERWRKANPDVDFVYVLFAFAGYKKGLEDYLERRVENLGGRLIILDDRECRDFVKKFSYEI